MNQEEGQDPSITEEIKEEDNLKRNMVSSNI